MEELLKKSRILTLFVVLAMLALTLPFVISCGSGEPAEETNPITELQSSVSTLKSDVGTLKSEVNTLKQNTSTNVTARVTALENSLGNLEADLLTLQTELAGGNPEIAGTIASILDDLQNHLAKLDAITVELETKDTAIVDIEAALAIVQADIEALQAASPTETNDYEARITTLETVVVSLTIDIVAVETSIDNIQDSLTAVEADIELFDEDLTQANDLLIDIGEQIDTIEARLVVVEGLVSKVYISEFLAGNSFLKFTTRTSGNYVVILTLYGTGLDTIDITIPTGQGAQEVAGFETWYGSGGMMRVIVIQPTPSGSPPVSPNWTANKTVIVNFPVGKVSYATIETGVR